MINFTGNLVHYTNVLKKNQDNKYTKQKVAFVELDMDSPYDGNFIHKIKESWDYPTDFVEVMSENFDYYHNNPYAPSPPRIFILTEQQDSFEKLNPLKALGLVQVSEEYNHDINIDLLQTNPAYINFDRESDIKYIGTTILDSLKEFFEGSVLKLFSTKDSIMFYIKNHFCFSRKNFYDNGQNLEYRA